MKSQMHFSPTVTVLTVHGVHSMPDLMRNAADVISWKVTTYGLLATQFGSTNCAILSSSPQLGSFEKLLPIEASSEIDSDIVEAVFTTSSKFKAALITVGICTLRSANTASLSIRSDRSRMNSNHIRCKQSPRTSHCCQAATERGCRVPD